MALVFIQEVTKSFGGVQAIQGSTFTIQEHQTTALIGPNGAGKTTLFDIISGFIPPDSGKIWFADEDMTMLVPAERARRGISRTFQQVRLFRYLRIQDHLDMVADHNDTSLWRQFWCRRPDRHERYEKILQTFGIDRSADTIVSDLSYGQRKLLELAMAISRPHRLLLLDEPVAGVNKVIQARIEELLFDLKRKGETILLIDHDMEFVRKLADQVVVLDAGRVIVDGPPEKVLRDKRVLEAYLGE